jgi:hypothetical protein
VDTGEDTASMAGEDGGLTIGWSIGGLSFPVAIATIWFQNLT